MSKNPRTTERDWQPGDGIRCAYADKSPREIPCGKPVKTAVNVGGSPVVGGRDVTRTRPLCANHAKGGWAPSEVMTRARKQALDQLVADHWDEYQDNVKSAIKRIMTETSP